MNKKRGAMDGLYARTDMKPQHPDAHEMMKRMKALQQKMTKREYERFIASQTQKPISLSGESRVGWPTMLRRRAASFFDDLRRYMDFCQARFMVWRETRRRSKGRKR
ncbi:MAG TPA: hypothetical protein VID27_03625 [Blastocatellia bacterium]